MCPSSLVAPRSYIFGIKHDVKGCVAYLEETDVVFPAGHTVVRMDTDATSKAQKIFSATPGALGIDAMATSRNKKYVGSLGSARPPSRVQRSRVASLPVGDPQCNPSTELASVLRGAGGGTRARPWVDEDRRPSLLSRAG